MNKVSYKFFGSSHSSHIAVIISGLKIGYKIDHEYIYDKLKARRSSFIFNTSRFEKDEFTIFGIDEYNTICQDQIAIVIPNKNVKSSDYLKGVIRPSHGDLIGYQLYGLDYDFAGGGKFSGRFTALYVVIGAIIESNNKELKVYCNIKKILDIVDDDISTLSQEQLSCLDPSFPVINNVIRDKMIELLTSCRDNGDSLGAKVVFRIDNLDVGIGGYYFNSFESILSKYIFGIGGVKAIEFGLGINYSDYYGSDVNDTLYVENGNIKSVKNMQGGINAGFSNGIDPVVFSVTFRPTPSVGKTMNTVKLTSDGYENYELNLKGRHDSFFANRAIAAVKACIYMAILEMEYNE